MLLNLTVTTLQVILECLLVFLEKKFKKEHFLIKGVREERKNNGFRALDII
jgi:hypothetical protein